jgi:hypothetical protein
MDQGIALSIWLGMAALTLVSAQILLWRTRRALDRPRQAAPIPECRPMPAAAVPVMASSVTAP